MNVQKELLTVQPILTVSIQWEVLIVPVILGLEEICVMV